MSEQVSNGEIYRILLEVRADVKSQNGRVRKLEDDALRIKTFWSAGVVLMMLFGDYLKRKVGL